MREILFRGKRIDNAEWVEGHLSQRKWGDGKIFESWIILDAYEQLNVLNMGNALVSEIGFECYKIDPETICQHTGYDDLRKKKAFEHDIVFCEDNGKSGHIVFEKGQYLIEWKDDDSLRSDIHFWFTERRMHIIGNIFDNPELCE